MSQEPFRITTSHDDGSVRGMLSTNPPPVIWAMARIVVARALKRLSRDWTRGPYDRWTLSISSPMVLPSAATLLLGFRPIVSKKILRAREYPLVWRPLEAMPITASPRFTDFCPFSIFDFSTTPTMVPLTSYSPAW